MRLPCVRNGEIGGLVERSDPPQSVRLARPFEAGSLTLPGPTRGHELLVTAWGALGGQLLRGTCGSMLHFAEATECLVPLKLPRRDPSWKGKSGMCVNQQFRSCTDAYLWPL